MICGFHIHIRQVSSFVLFAKISTVSSTRKVQLAEYGLTGQVGILVLAKILVPCYVNLNNHVQEEPLKQNPERERHSYRKPTIWVSII